MTLTEIDQALEEWQAKIATASENLLALEDLPVVHRLQSQTRSKLSLLTGRTAEKVQPALMLLPQLFQDISLLTNVINRARELRRPLTAFWKPNHTLDQIEDLLLGPSVALPAVQTPFSQRSLLSASEQAQALTLSALLALMSQAFEEVKATLLETESAWTEGEAALQAAQDKAAVLEQIAASLGETDAADLTKIRAYLGHWKGLIATDPLGHSADGGKGCAEMLRQTRERLEEAAATRDKASHLREKARARMEQWNEARRKAEVARAQVAIRIAAPPPHGPDRLPEMRRWLATLEDTYARRHWLAAEVGFGHWLQTAGGYLEEEEYAARTCAAWLAASEELPGRLSALRAKASARALGSHPDLVRLGWEADTVLRQKPLPLARAETAVTAYTDLLNTLLKKKA